MGVGRPVRNRPRLAGRSIETGEARDAPRARAGRATLATAVAYSLPMRLAITLLALFLAGCTAHAGGAPASRDLVIAAGTQGRLASSEPEGRRRAPWIETAVTRQEFIGHWNEYVPGKPDNVLQTIDFATERAIFLLLGPQQTGGYAIEPFDVKVEGTTIRVHAKLVQPMSPDDFVTQAITAPYAVVRGPSGTHEKIEWVDADGRLLATRIIE